MNNQILKTQTDNELVFQAKEGNQKAIGELYTRYYMLVFSKCLSFTKNTNDASDQAQDVMLKVIEKIKTFKGDAKFSTWLYAITFNYCTDNLRKSKNKYTSVDQLLDLVDFSDLEREFETERASKVDKAGRALLALPTEDQQLLLMKYQSNKSISELQVAYELSASAVKMRLKRARTKAVSAYTSYIAEG